MLYRSILLVATCLCSLWEQPCNAQWRENFCQFRVAFLLDTAMYTIPVSERKLRRSTCVAPKRKIKGWSLYMIMDPKKIEEVKKVHLRSMKFYLRTANSGNLFWAYRNRRDDRFRKRLSDLGAYDIGPGNLCSLDERTKKEEVSYITKYGEHTWITWYDLVVFEQVDRANDPYERRKEEIRRYREERRR